MTIMVMVILRNFIHLYLGHQNEATFIGGVSERHPRRDDLVFFIFRIRGRYVY